MDRLFIAFIGAVIGALAVDVGLSFWVLVLLLMCNAVVVLILERR